MRPWQTLETEELPGGVRYVLPRRNAGVVRWLSLPLIFVGGGIALFAALFITIAFLASGGASRLDGLDVLSFLVYCAILLPFLVLGVALFGTGMYLLAGNAVVQLREHRLMVSNGWWFLRRRRRFDASELQCISLTRPLETSPGHWRAPNTGELYRIDQEALAEQSFDDVKNSTLAVLSGDLAGAAGNGSLHFEGLGRQTLARVTGYPTRLLRAVAEGIAERSQVAFEDGTLAVAQSAVRRENESNVATDDVTETPAQHSFTQPAQAVNGIASTPIASASASFRDKRLVQNGPRSLAIAPSLAGHVVDLFIASLGAAPVGAVVFSDQVRGIGSVLLFLAIGLPFLLLGLALLTKRAVRFEQVEGELTYGWRWSRQSRDLSEVQAIQIIPGKYCRPRNKGGGTSKSGGYQPFELNLVSTNGTRLNLSNHTNLQWTRETGRELATLLETPLVDQT